jgi:hypothetical protein
MYKLMKTKDGYESIRRLEDGANIPFDPANTDYSQFKKDILEGAELLDADGQVMDATQFVNTLP